MNGRSEEQSQNRDGKSATHGFNFIANLTEVPTAAKNLVAARGQFMFRAKIPKGGEGAKLFLRFSSHPSRDKLLLLFSAEV
jgi:hypothetical protein